MAELQLAKFLKSSTFIAPNPLSLMKTLALFLVAMFSLNAIAQTSDCQGPVSQAELNINNVRAVISNGLQHFENQGDPGYEVPKAAPGVASRNSIYADGLWMGGYDSGGQLHLAAVTYRVGGASDYFAGPLRTDLSASTSEAVCDQFDDVYVVERSDALLHKEYYDRVEAVAGGADPSILSDPPFQNGHNTPASFLNWPATHSDPGYSYYLAPFYDRNADGEYNPEDGDYPGFDLEGSFDCQNYSLTDPLPLLGHQAAWYVSNDAGLHTESGGSSIGVEIQVTAFQYANCDDLNNSTFVRNLLINRSSNSYSNFIIGKWVDMDLGCPTDDYVGCDVARGLAYGYNGDLDDASCSGIPGYDFDLVAQGVKIFQGPHQDADGLDNPLIADIDAAAAGLGIVYEGQGTNYGDGIPDNERYGMNSFVYYNRNDQTPTPTINGEPNLALDFYSYLSGVWKNGEPMTYGGDGLGIGEGADYMFPGLSDPLGVSTDGAITDGNWSEETEATTPGDRRFIMSTGRFNMQPGEVNELILGYIFGQDTTGQSNAIAQMIQAYDVVQTHFDNCFQVVEDFPLLTEFSTTGSGSSFEFSLPLYSADEVSWDFGDGTTSTGYSVTHNYTAPGYYEVCASHSLCGSTIDLCETIYVSPSSFYPILEITRKEGRGCGNEAIFLPAQEIENILEGPEYYEEELTYIPQSGPIKVTVFDETSFVPGDYAVRLYGDDEEVPDQWKLWKVGETDTIFSQQSLDGLVDQYIPEYGLVVSIEQPDHSVPGSLYSLPNLLNANMGFEDPAINWLTGVPDTDENTEQNWIRAGSQEDLSPGCDPLDPSEDCYYNDKIQVDPEEDFESIIGGTWSPYHLVSQSIFGPFNSDFSSYQIISATRMTHLNNVVIQLTADKSKWTRSAVVETQNFPQFAIGQATKNKHRMALSVDKNGLNQLNGGDYDECTMNGVQVMDQEQLDDLSPEEIEQYKLASWPTADPSAIPDSDLLGLSFGMGWFPGFAVDTETGYRVHVAFGENSALPLENGADMIWNPTSTMWNPSNPDTSDPYNARFGGGHYIYVFRNFAIDDHTDNERMRAYDDGNYLYENLNYSVGTTQQKRVWRSCTWVSMPILRDGFSLLPIQDGLIPSTVTIRLNVSKIYQVQMYDAYVEESIRFPLYNFTVPSDIFSSVDEFDQERLELYPNPTSDILNVKLGNDQSTIVGIDIMDYAGRVLRSEGFTHVPSCVIDLKSISSGIYLIRVRDSDGQSVVKPFVRR